MKTSCRQRWHRRTKVARQHLAEAAQRLARGFGLWEGALYEIGGRIPCRPSLPTSLVSPPTGIVVHPRILHSWVGDRLWRYFANIDLGCSHTSHNPGILDVAPYFSPIGLFGTGIQSYFTFLRFLLLLNLLTLLLTACFVLWPLLWLHPPEQGPALKLSECWDCPDLVGLRLGMLHGLALDSP